MHGASLCELAASGFAQPSIEREWPNDAASNACGIGMLGMDDEVVLLRHDERLNAQQRGLPGVIPCIAQALAFFFARKLRPPTAPSVVKESMLVEIIRYVEFQQQIVFRYFIRMHMHEHFQDRERDGGGAINEAAPRRIPTTAGETRTLAIERRRIDPLTPIDPPCLQT